MLARAFRHGALLAGVAVLGSACGILPSSPSSKYAVGGVVSGLAGTGLVLAADDGQTLPVGRNGRFELADRVESGAAYAITIAAQPTQPAQTCRVLRGSGVVAGAAVTDVEVACALVVGAFNLENFGSDDSASKKQGIADIVHATGFAVMGVEEVASATLLAAFAAQYLGPTWDERLGASGGYDQHVGLLYDTALVTVVDSGELDSTRSGGIIVSTSYPWAGGMRLPYYARLQTVDGGRELELVVVHLKANGDSSSCTTRSEQVLQLQQWLAQHEGATLAVVGDFNDEIPGTGICSSLDTLGPFESDPGLTFLTAKPDSMASTYYTNINYRSTIDHVLATASFVSLTYDLDSSGHKAAVVMDGDTSISDHQPPYVYLAW